MTNGNHGRLPRLRENKNTVKSLISKIIADPNEGRYGVTRGKDGVSPSKYALGTLSRTVTGAINDSENILVNLPDTELSMMVVVSSILSPNDMRSGELTWAYDLPVISPELGGAMLDYLKNYFEDDYELKKKLPTAIENALFKTGSYPLIVIPESAVDAMINGTATISTESIKHIMDDKFICRSKGILGRGLGADGKKSASGGLESLLGALDNPTAVSSEVDVNLHVTDNLDALKIPYILEARRATAIRSKHVPIGLESLYDVGNLNVSMYRARNTRLSEMQRIRTNDKYARVPIGHPMVIQSPSDSIIPVHRPSAPEDHLGYYLLLDELGYPLNNATDSTYYQQLKNMSNTAPDDATSALLKRSRFLQEGYTGANSNEQTLNQLSQAYGKMVEMDLLERLRNGLYGDAVEIKESEEIYRIMFARAMAGMKTQVLYIPAELVTYFAFDYNHLGIGVGLLEKSKFLASIRSMLTYANLMGQMSNSVPRRNLTITLDEVDLEPEKRVNAILNEYQRINNAALPFDGGRPLDVINGIRNANISVNVVGSPNYPETAISVDDVNSNRQPIDMTLSETIAKQHGMALGVTPDLIDATTTIDFAVQQLTSNLFFTRRIAMYQEITSSHCEDHVYKYTTNSGTLMAGLIRLIREHRELEKLDKQIADDLADTKDLESGLDEVDAAAANPDTPGAPAAMELPETTDADPFAVFDINKAFEETRKEEGVSSREKIEPELDELTIIEDFLCSLSITLPPPDTTKLSNQMDLYNQFGQAVDAVLPAYVSEELLQYKYGDAGRESAPLIITVVKGFFLRQFLAQNNILPELKALVGTNGEDEKLLDMLEHSELHLDNIHSTIGSLVELMMKKRNPETPEDTDDYSGGYTPPSSAEEDDTGGGEGEEFGDALDFDLDIGLDENAEMEDTGTAEETPEATAEGEAEAAPEAPAEGATEPETAPTPTE